MRVGFGSKEPKVVELDQLKTSLSWVMALLSCIIALLLCIKALLEAESSFGILGVAEPCGRFFWSVIILELSRVEKILSFSK